MKYQFLPKWQRELDSFTKIKNTFILEGNINDIYPVYTKDNDEIVINNFVNINTYIYKFYTTNHHDYNICFYDTVQGFYNPFDSIDLKKLLDTYDTKKNSISEVKASMYTKYPCDVLDASNIIKNAMLDNEMKLEQDKRKPFCFILNYASRFTLNPGHLDKAETDLFMNLYYASINGNEILCSGNERKKNVLFILVDKINDLPAWFYLQNPNSKLLSISHPEKIIREAFIKLRFKELQEDDQTKQKELKKFVDATEGLMCEEIKKIKTLHQQTPNINYTDAVFLYKYGIKDNPWDTLDLDEIGNAEEFVTKRVKGQEVAVSKTLDVVKRAISGFSGLQHSSSSRPKGILFFAGPTGTGKTEMAKTLAEMLFGDESLCIRFDMSEYQQPQSDQKLLGAPPGYVGYESGGQLTNQVREKPFSLLLFDEIEKAHPSILDKFLQILDDGRMTDGQGNTVYFSETLIVFTSNLGIYRTEVKNGMEQKVQVVDSKMDYKEIEEKVKAEIKDYFTTKLGRPEILNRIGNNIIVFDFIRDNAVRAIVQKQIKNIETNMFNQKHITIKSDKVIDFLIEKAKTNLDNGGRGIGNIVEEYYLSPLGRFCFDNKIKEGNIVEVLEIIDSKTIDIKCKVS